ncbi:HAUS augmin-like complex subunit 5 [Marchantia polymorpha subsp. ruderalis]|uniref:AUGMIN subunit 5 n=2 Tax=Marchantia polymorpha TaxID=3197 RepID=A0AAF6BQR4_MARPO|nr:hypothetical protein MARPO_0016s0130 [Marchantia polymorpha]BBN14348.1 hypothetical protein Mp_6g10920 [Marchantia polymorpha subsp. ruderalis]|eukprot:PTQ45080.1 hypothetical protein MARPO_0016s0130 [Marchantia polymorpha]
MQTPATTSPRADSILDWLEQEMGYRLPPSADAITKICRGNMLPIWKFLLERVKSEKTVDKIRRNIHVHGNNVGTSTVKDLNVEENQLKRNESGKLERRGSNAEEESTKHMERDRRRLENKLKTSGSSRNVKVKEVREKESTSNERGSDAGDQREKALLEREDAEKEVARLRHMIERSLKEMKGRMSDLSTEEGERQRVLDEKSNSRHKQVLLEAYDQRCEQAIRILTEYWRRLHTYVEHARESQRGRGWSDGTNDRFRREPSMYATAVRGERLSDENIFIETAEERSIRVTCEMISGNLVEKIRGVFHAYDGDSAKGENHMEETKLGFVVDGGDGIPEQVKETALSLLRNPPHLLQAMIGYTSRIVANVNKETEKIDIRADAERLRYRYENNRITEDGTSGKEKSTVTANQVVVQEKSKACLDITNRGIFKQLRERQTAHVQQFMATEEMLNLAAEAKSTTEELVKRMSGAVNGGQPAYMNGNQNAGGLRQIELEVWGKERELAGLKSSVDMLTSEIQRLKMMCEERKQAKEDLRRKWRKIEEFNARRMELESVYGALIHANRTAAMSWEQHMTAARELSNTTIVPVCTTLQNDVNYASDMIEREVGAFTRSPDNRLYLFPAFSQGLLDAMGASNASGPEAVAAVHRNADLMTARAGAGDPSAISSINRINAALQSLSGVAGEGADAGLVAVVESLQFFFRHKVSSANLLEDLAREVNQMQLLRDLVTSGRMLLAAANSSRPEYERCKFMYEGRTTLTAEWQVLDTEPRNAAACAATAIEQEKIALEQWLPELKAAVQEAQKCLENSKRVRGLVDEWWEQPASTAVDWITVDGQNVAAWLAHVKQLQVAFYEKQLL